MAVDGRLLKKFRGVRPRGQTTRLRLDEDVEVVETVVGMTRGGAKTAEIAEALNLSPSAVNKLKREFRERI